MNKKSRARAFGTLLGVVLVAAACSSGRGGTATATTGAAGSNSTAAPTAQKFGTLASPCGPGTAKGATDQGVTDTSIRIAYGDDRGFPQSPGLNKEIGDAVKAMIKWCNDQGGISGRQIQGDFYDAAITQVNNVMQQACQSDFMLVGEGWALDGAAEQTRLGCNLVAVPAYSVCSGVRQRAGDVPGVAQPRRLPAGVAVLPGYPAVPRCHQGRRAPHHALGDRDVVCQGHRGHEGGGVQHGGLRGEDQLHRRARLQALRPEVPVLRHPDAVH